jgi:hypothetical protein
MFMGFYHKNHPFFFLCPIHELKRYFERENRSYLKEGTLSPDKSHFVDKLENANFMSNQVFLFYALPASPFLKVSERVCPNRKNNQAYGNPNLQL